MGVRLHTRYGDDFFEFGVACSCHLEYDHGDVSIVEIRVIEEEDEEDG